jgi:putative molybdopterin biosynthesis protein
VAKGNPLDIFEIGDIYRQDIRFVNRQKGSGTRQLLDFLLGDFA